MDLKINLDDKDYTLEEFKRLIKSINITNVDTVDKMCCKFDKLTDSLFFDDSIDKNTNHDIFLDIIKEMTKEYDRYYLWFSCSLCRSIGAELHYDYFKGTYREKLIPKDILSAYNYLAFKITSTYMTPTKKESIKSNCLTLVKYYSKYREGLRVISDKRV